MIAFGLVAAVASGLLAGMFLGPPLIAWLSGGVLAALIVGAFSPQGRAQLSPRVAISRKEANSKFNLEIWQVLTAFLALFLLIAGIVLEGQFIDDHAAINTSFFSVHTISLLSTELAFALIIALAISVTIEKHARDRDYAAHETQRKHIAEDVFRGVFSAQLPANYINAVVDRNLKVRVIRPWVRIVEDISEVEPEIIAKARLGEREFLRCDRLIEYALQNVTTQAVTETLQVFFPIKRADVSEFTGMDFLSIGDKRWTKKEILELRVRDNDSLAIHYECPIEIQPGQTIEVKLHTRHFKYMSDSELWSSIYATMRFDLIFRCSISLQALGLRNSSLQPVTSEYVEPERGMGNWTVDGPLLPGDSISYWWSVAQVPDPMLIGSR
jgi:hypothetical protein